MNRPPSKSFRCEVVSETVTIALRRRASLDGNNELYVRCSELDCQYIDGEQPPCPSDPRPLRRRGQGAAGAPSADPLRCRPAEFFVIRRVMV